MKLLFDHNLPRRFRLELPGHDISTTYEMRWELLRNGLLLREAANAGFEAVIGVDKNLEHEQNLETLPLPVIVMDAASNSLEGLKPFAKHVLNLIEGPLERRLYLIDASGKVVTITKPRRRA